MGNDRFDEYYDPAAGAERFVENDKGKGKGRASKDQAPKKERRSQSGLLLDELDGVELWHDPDREAFATLPINTHHENHRVRSKPFKLWLIGRYYKKHNGAPGGQGIEDALKVIEAQAIYDCQEYATWIRTGEADDAMYLDLGNEAWQAVKVTPEGRELISWPPLKFIRPRAMRPLYLPAAGGSIDDLREFVNLTESEFKILVGWLLAALRPRGPYPILLVSGHHGSAKTTLVKIVRMLIDGNKAPTRSPPEKERELMVAAQNSHVIAFDNLSWVPEWLSDALCRLSAGGGFGVRELFADREEVVFGGVRPIVLNGIPDLASRPDLADRAVVVSLAPIDDDARRCEDEFWPAFERAAPGILGALLDGVAAALGGVEAVERRGLPRMADFAAWVTAAESALGWKSGAFLEAYRMNRAEAVVMALEADVVAVEIRKLLHPDKPGDRRVPYLNGSPSDVLARLEEYVDERIKNSKAWPKAANAFSGRVRRVADALRGVGIEVTMGRVGRGKARKNNILIAPLHDPEAGAGTETGDEHDWGEVERPAPAL